MSIIEACQENILREEEWLAVALEIRRIGIIDEQGEALLIELLKDAAISYCLHSAGERDGQRHRDSAKKYEFEVKESLVHANKLLTALSCQGISGIISDGPAEELRKSLKNFVSCTEASLSNIEVLPSERGAPKQISTYRLALSFEHLWGHFDETMTPKRFNVAANFFSAAGCTPNDRRGDGTHSNVKQIFREAKRLKTEGNAREQALLEPFLLIGKLKSR